MLINETIWHDEDGNLLKQPFLCKMVVDFHVEKVKKPSGEGRKPSSWLRVAVKMEPGFAVAVPIRHNNVVPIAFEER